MLNILRAGLATSIQDFGRYHWRQYGIGVSGVPGSTRHDHSQSAGRQSAGQRRAGNCPRTVQSGIPSGWVVCTNGSGLSGRTGWQACLDRLAFTGKKGQVLVLKKPIHGMRSYLAVHGGFAIPPVLGSCSTDIKAGFGGFEGRTLQDGDGIPLGKPQQHFTSKKACASCSGVIVFGRYPDRNTTNSAKRHNRRSGEQPGS